LENYGKECFKFTGYFLRVTLFKEGQDTEQVTKQVKKLLMNMGDEKYTANELMELSELKHRPTFLYDYLQPAIKLGLIKMTIPDKPNSRKQRYILTEKGKKYISDL